MDTRQNSESSLAYRSLLLNSLFRKGEDMLSLLRADGRMGTDPWIVRDQDGILTLTLLYLTPGNPLYRESNLLTKIGLAGCYLRKQQDGLGMYAFDKKDGSNWGMIYMPWTYLRWIVTYHLLREELSTADRKEWEEGLRLGYQGIAATELSSLSNIYPGPLPGQPPLAEGEVRPWLHNIPCHHAAGLFLAGREFHQPDWCEQARVFMSRIVEVQSEHGWWTEHSGPVVLYNRIYLEALALYCHFSKDEVVLGALERGNRFQWNYTYPNGAAIETIDERNPYSLLKVKEAEGVRHFQPERVPISPAMYFSEEGRAHLRHQFPVLQERDPADLDNSEYMLLCLPPDDQPVFSGMDHPRRYSMSGEALVARESPWLVSFSAYCAPRTGNRFIQDRQNLISLYHSAAGLILGGGNTKIQPYWSTMTVGHPGLISPVGSKRDTNLAPEVDLLYVPDEAGIEEVDANQWNLRVRTGTAVTLISIILKNELEAEVTATLLAPDDKGRPVENHLTLLPFPGECLYLPDGRQLPLTGEDWRESGLASFRYHRCEVFLPESATLRWPVLPHNPYRGDGEAEPVEGRLVISLPAHPGRESIVRFRVVTETTAHA